MCVVPTVGPPPVKGNPSLPFIPVKPNKAAGTTGVLKNLKIPVGTNA